MISSTLISSSSITGTGFGAGIGPSLGMEERYLLDVPVLNSFFEKSPLTGLEIACWKDSTAGGCSGVVEVGVFAGTGVDEASFGTPLILTPCLFFAILEAFEDMMRNCRERDKEKKNKDFKIAAVRFTRYTMKIVGLRPLFIEDIKKIMMRFSSRAQHGIGEKKIAVEVVVQKRNLH